MIAQNLESEIIERVKFLNDPEKSHVLEYIDRIPRKVHSTKLYRKRAMKQIRAALNENF